MAEITLEFMGMATLFIFGLLLLIACPLTWVPFSFTGILTSHYEIALSNCNASYFSKIGDPSRSSANWYIYSYGACKGATGSPCLSFSGNLTDWSVIDRENAAAGFKSNLVGGVQNWQESSCLTVLGLIAVLVYCLCFLAMLYKPKWDNICITTQSVCLLISFGVYFYSVVDELNSSQVNYLSWQTSYFKTCQVAVQPSFGHYSIVYILTTEGMLLAAYLLTCTSWYCYACGCFRFFYSLFTGSCLGSSSGSNPTESSSLLTSTELSSIDFSSGQARGKKKVMLLISDTGGGHRASANAIAAAMNKLYPNMIETEVVDMLTQHANWPFQDAVNHYRIFTQYPWLWKISYDFVEFPTSRRFAELLMHISSFDSYRAAILASDPDLIISVHPLMQGIPTAVVGEMNERIKLNSVDRLPVSFVTVVTDLIDANQQWFCNDADLIFVPTESVREHILKGASGVEDSKICLHGLPIREPFWEPITLSKLDMRMKLKIHPTARTVLLMAGGDGVGGLEDITTAIVNKLDRELTITDKQTSHLDVKAQLIVVCGHNKAIVESLSNAERVWPASIQVVVLGFVSNVDQLMVASDLLVTKAGPGTIAEAMIVGLPMVLSSFLPGQEAGNVPFVVDNGFGLYSGEEPQSIAANVLTLISDEKRLKAMSSAAKALSKPRATVSIAEDICKILFRNTPEVTKATIRRSQSVSFKQHSDL